jgi:hypothetical protein
MTRALLLHRGDAWAASLEQILGRRYSLVAARDYRISSDFQLEHEILAANLVVVDVSIDDREMRKVLRIIRRVKTHCRTVLALVCVSRVNRGPRFQYDIEEIGARFVYGQ